MYVNGSLLYLYSAGRICMMNIVCFLKPNFVTCSSFFLYLVMCAHMLCSQHTYIAQSMEVPVGACYCEKLILKESHAMVL